MPHGQTFRRRLSLTAAAMLLATACSTSTVKPGRAISEPLTTSTSSAARSTPPAGPQEPFALTQYVTDLAGALPSSARDAAESAIDRLYDDRRIRLWVVFVRDFTRIQPGLSAADNASAWAQQTMQVSNFGTTDALFAVAIEGRAYSIQVGPGVDSINQSEIDSLLADVKPDLQRSDWAGAALTVANGLNAAAGPP